jgi:putative DNA primase/helicase
MVQPYHFICENCHSGYSKEEFENLDQKAEPYLPGSDIFLVKVSCSNCGHKTAFTRKVEDGTLYQGEMWLPDNVKPNELESYYLLFLSAITEQYFEPISPEESPRYEQPSSVDTEIDASYQEIPSPPPPPPINQGPVEKPIDQKAEFEMTDVGNAERLVHLHGSDIRYCASMGWYVWDGKIWRQDIEETKLTQKAIDTAKSIKKETKDAPSDKINAILKHAKSSQSAGKIKSMVKLAASDEKLFITPDKLDANGWLINLQNGYFDFRNISYQAMPHARKHLMTKIMNVAYDRTATCPLWEAFLNKILKGNKNLIQFLQRAVGYTLTGNTSEQCLFFLYGEGANGKTTFIETIRDLMGDYAVSADFDTFLEKQGIRNDLARLKGARFVPAVESGAGKAFAERLIKMITGEDQITARFLYKEFFEYKPTYKIFLATNHKPTIHGTEIAIWRRIMPIEFNVVIPEKERDKELISKLKKEKSGILNWAIEGLMEWRKHGLNLPNEVILAREKYRAEMDHISEFLKECCVEGPGAKAPSDLLYEVYTKWCLDNEQHALEKNDFGRKLTGRGFELKKKTFEPNVQKQGRLGLAIKPEYTQ